MQESTSRAVWDSTAGTLQFNIAQLLRKKYTIVKSAELQKCRLQKLQKTPVLDLRKTFAKIYNAQCASKYPERHRFSSVNKVTFSATLVIPDFMIVRFAVDLLETLGV